LTFEFFLFIQKIKLQKLALKKTGYYIYTAFGPLLSNSLHESPFFPLKSYILVAANAAGVLFLTAL